MKKFVAFVMVLSLGLFCAVGCAKQPPKKPVEPPKTEAKEGEKAPATGEKAAPEAAAPEAAAPAEKPAEK